MRENQTLVEDLMVLGGNILGNLLGARHELSAQARQRMDELARRLALVSRGEFDAAFAMLAKARTMQEELHERLSVIETKLNLSSAKRTPHTAKVNLPSVKRKHRSKKRR